MIRINQNSQLFNKQMEHIVALVKKTKEIETFYLFGSTAENKNRPNSDIDFAVLLNSKLQKKESRIQESESKSQDEKNYWFL